MDHDHTVRVSIADQQLAIYHKGEEIGRYKVSTSRFGVGDRPGSCDTPLGRLQVAAKIGDGAPLGMKFKDRRPTGEVVKVNAPGRDPIVTRILWLKGMEAQNQHAFKRTIYIHGTPEEWRIGTPASFGCIRMRSRDIVVLYRALGKGAEVDITIDHLPSRSGTPAPNVADVRSQAKPAPAM